MINQRTIQPIPDQRRYYRKIIRLLAAMALTLTSMVTITAPAMAAPGDFFICDRKSGNEQVWPKKIGLEDKDDIIETVGLEFKNIKRSGGDISGFSRGKDVSFRLKLREAGQLSIRFQISATSNYDSVRGNPTGWYDCKKQ